MRNSPNWLPVSDQSPHVYRAAHDMACALAGDGETPVNLPTWFTPCFSRVLMVERAGKALVYSMDEETGEVCAELIAWVGESDDLGRRDYDEGTGACED